jgi:hypothetical protein
MNFENEIPKEFLNLNPNLEYNKENILLKDGQNFPVEQFLTNIEGTICN